MSNNFAENFILMKTKLILLIFLLVPIFLSFGQFDFNAWTTGATSGTITNGTCQMAVNINNNGSPFQNSGPRYDDAGVSYSPTNGEGLALDQNWTNTSTSTVVTLTFTPSVSNPTFRIYDINRNNPCTAFCGSAWTDRITVQSNTGTLIATPQISSEQTITTVNARTKIIEGNIVCNGVNGYVDISITGTIASITITYTSGAIVDRTSASAPNLCSSVGGETNCLANRVACTDPARQYITIGSITTPTCFTAMPVEFAYFNYKCTDQTQLVWETNSERNNDYFMVYESSDGVHFEPIRQIDGVGNNLTPTQYQTLVFGSRLQTMYYKLEQVDFDGTKTELATLSIPANCQSSDELYVVGPNPFKNELTIEHHNQENSQLSIINAEGKLIYESTLEETKNQHFIPTDSWSKGVYVVRIQSKTKIENYRIIKD